MVPGKTYRPRIPEPRFQTGIFGNSKIWQFLRKDQTVNSLRGCRDMLVQSWSVQTLHLVAMPRNYERTAAARGSKAKVWCEFFVSSLRTTLAFHSSHNSTQILERAWATVRPRNSSIFGISRQHVFPTYSFYIVTVLLLPFIEA